MSFLLLAFIVNGLENIDSSPLDGHEWRQTLTIAMAKGYIERPNILYPTTIVGGNSDIMTSEFPIYTYL